MSDNTERVTVIEDNDFMNTDISELVEGDYYLFHLTNYKMYIYKDGVVCVAYFDSCGAESFNSVEYSKGTLQEYVDGL